MDKELIEKYKKEMIRLYGRKTVNPNPVSTELPKATEKTDSGNLVAMVTAIRSLYPVKGAKVTVFTGDINKMQIADTDYTDQSGKTKIFTLPTPERSLSLSPESKILPYGVYNMMVEADGYLTNVHLNIPVFSGITSVQSTNMTLLETAGVDKGPQIFDESGNYNL